MAFVKIEIKPVKLNAVIQSMEQILTETSKKDLKIYMQSVVNNMQDNKHLAKLKAKPLSI